MRPATRARSGSTISRQWSAFENITRDRHGLAAGVGDELSRLRGVLVLGQVAGSTSAPSACERDRHRPPDAAVATC